jgi:hypothetical protein
MDTHAIAVAQRIIDGEVATGRVTLPLRVDILRDAEGRNVLSVTVDHTKPPPK